MTWRNLLLEGRQRLLPAFHDESAEEVMHEARFLLSWASGLSAAWLLAHGDEEAVRDAGTFHDPTDSAGSPLVERYRAALACRVNREPAAYITGQAGFCGQLFDVNPAVLIPRPDTELLVEIVSAFMQDRAAVPERQENPSVDDHCPGHFQGPRILEIGTGSGCISCILALNHEKLHAAAVDISGDALAVAHRNASRLGVSGRIRFYQADVLSEDLSDVLSEDLSDVLSEDLSDVLSDVLSEDLSADPSSVRYDAIVSNPPYIPTADLAGLMPDVARYEPHIALDGGTDGLLFYRRLLRVSKDLLKQDGLLAVEIGYNQGITVPDLFREAGFVPTVHFDPGGNPRVVTAKAALGQTHLSD